MEAADLTIKSINSKKAGPPFQAPKHIILCQIGKKPLILILNLVYHKK